jgi:hypothetical protein
MRNLPLEWIRLLSLWDIVQLSTLKLFQYVQTPFQRNPFRSGEVFGDEGPVKPPGFFGRAQMRWIRLISLKGPSSELLQEDRRETGLLWVEQDCSGIIPLGRCHGAERSDSLMKADEVNLQGDLK